MGYFLAICIGGSLGLLGGGGSVLALPVLVYVMGIAPKPAIAMTLIIVGTISLFGSIPYALRGHLNFKAAGIFGSATMVGAYLGARIATLPFVTSAFQMILFSLLMLVAAGLMIYRTNRADRQDSQNQLETGEYIQPACKYCWLWLMTEGIAVGILTGLIGVGGGFAIVPALVLLGKLPMREAIGTSLLIIACNSVAGLMGYLGHINLVECQD
ncbi:sulfite exporter TauE/SafE family protein [Alkalinema pantanalense CENA528]|uniref:sulfite exporter TauE/SafE family protein n=1 Tax=Alkalinema pantanalense TaxID=1620705 RepID=UPI003D6E9221